MNFFLIQLGTSLKSTLNHIIFTFPFTHLAFHLSFYHTLIEQSSFNVLNKHINHCGQLNVNKIRYPCPPGDDSLEEMGSQKMPTYKLLY